jgi:metallophosphoesterase superfamily enzyme
MRILVISDIHAYGKLRTDGSRPSLVRAGDTSDTAPTVEFCRLLQQGLQQGRIPKPDLVVTPGDLSDQADQPGPEFAWRFLVEIANLSELRLLLGTVGNHDVDSRYYATDHDPKGMLLALKPGFPVVANNSPAVTDATMMQLMFWAHNFYILPVNNYRFVVVNSSAYHGMGRDNAECEHGRISAHTLHQIKRALDRDDEVRSSRGEPSYLLNILLCHHHLEKDGQVDDPDRSQMMNAHALMEMISSADHGRWMVIHGHRHRARLFQAGGMTGPFVLSSASFAATRDRDYDNTSPNQVHLIDLDPAGMIAHGFYPAGQIRTWTWQTGMGWLSDRYGAGGLPPTTGFGFRGSLDALAREVAAQVAHLPCKWVEICSRQPAAAYLDHKQIQDLRTTLRRQFQVECMFGEDGMPYECGKS